MTPRRWDPDIQGGDLVVIALLAVAVVALVCSVFSPQLTASVSAVVSTAFGGASGYASRTSRLRRDDAVRVTDDALGELRGLESLRKIEEGKHDDEVQTAVAAAVDGVADDGLSDLVARANRIIRSVREGGE